MSARESTDVASALEKSPETNAIAKPHRPLKGPHTREGAICSGWDTGTTSIHRHGTRVTSAKVRDKLELCAALAPHRSVAAWLSGPHKACQAEAARTGQTPPPGIGRLDLIDKPPDDPV